ncbi:hypothetical protein GJ496_005233 [Pomphorhynchus laevis]|nr:hypothetical protein GJ496_005233 [Pomphorhynchus laevis]
MRIYILISKKNCVCERYHKIFSAVIRETNSMKIIGEPDLSFYERADTISQFENIKKWLVKNQKKCAAENDQITGKSLSQLVVQLLNFQNRHFGVQSNNKINFTRIPVECFLDFRADGALCRLLSILYEYKYMQGWKRIDLSSVTRFEKHLDLFERIVNDLKENNCLVYPTCYLRPEISNKMQDELKRIIKKHNGFIATAEDDADHVVFPICEDSLPRSSERVWARAVQQKFDQTLVHFWFHPDSCDKWLIKSLTTSLGEPMINDNCGIWQVSANWILDTDYFNEWMNEEDYEIDEDLFSTENKCQYKIHARLRPVLSLPSDQDDTMDFSSGAESENLDEKQSSSDVR